MYAYAYFSPNLTKPRKILFVKVYKVRLQDFRGFLPFFLHFTQPMSAVCPQNWAISYHFECCHSILHQTKVLCTLCYRHLTTCGQMYDVTIISKPLQNNCYGNHVTILASGNKCVYVKNRDFKW